jgi:flagellar basal body-associated protein FliL
MKQKHIVLIVLAVTCVAVLAALGIAIAAFAKANKGTESTTTATTTTTTAPSKKNFFEYYNPKIHVNCYLKGKGISSVKQEISPSNILQ